MDDTRPEPTRERVVRIATKLFAEQGFEATGVQEISTSSGIGKGALYHHIKSKNKLLADVAIELLTRARDAAEDIVRRDKDVVARLEMLAGALATDLAGHRDAWIISMRDWTALEGQDRANVASLRREYEEYWQALFDEGAKLGVWAPVHPVLRRAIIGMFTSSYRWIEQAGPLTTEQICGMYLAFIKAGLKPGGPDDKCGLSCPPVKG